ncbi:MAG TPA: LolA-related protein [Rhodanobacteraceae bacterium]|nr:LolA-related protein [Rhodanobacteraceae bacterium]
MKTTKRIACALLAMAPLAAIAANTDLATGILAGMAKQGSAQTAFIEVSYRGMLDRPLITSGTMKWLGGDKLERDVEKPYRAVAKIGDGQMSVERPGHPVQTMPISRAPQMAAILTGFRALLGGDTATLARDFEVQAVGNPARWVLTLRPRSDELKHRVQSIVIDGRDNAPRCMTLSESDGDTTITLLGKLAEQGLRSTAPLQSAVAARCRND